MFVDGIYNAVAPTATDGKNIQLQVDINGNLKIVSVGASVGGGITYTDKTITSGTGSSQTLAAASATRKSIIMANGASPAGVNLLGGTAAIGGAGTITLQPYEKMRLAGVDCPVVAITVILSSGAYFSALEGA